MNTCYTNTEFVKVEVGSILGRTVAHKAQDKLQAPLWFPVPSAPPPQQFHNQQELQAHFDIIKK